jgi:hypothetical protein
MDLGELTGRRSIVRNAETPLQFATELIAKERTMKIADQLLSIAEQRQS